MEKTTDEKKKSLSVADLAKEIGRIKATKDGAKMTSTEIQKAIRETGYTFSKDKWTEATEWIVDGCPEVDEKEDDCDLDCECGECPNCCGLSDEEDEAADELDAESAILFDAIDDAEVSAEDVVAKFFINLKKDSLKDASTIASLSLCPAAYPEVYRLLDLACEAGLLERVVGYRLTDDALKYFKKEQKNDSAKSDKKAQKKA